MGLNGRAVQAGVQAALRFVYVAVGHSPGASRRLVEVRIAPGGDAGPAERAELRAAAGFLVDSLGDAVAPEELARSMACFFFASAAGRRHDGVAVTLGDGAGLPVAVELARPDFEVEPSGFGAAHVIYESVAFGLYVLEVAPEAAIPAHFHRVMEESELVLDAGLLQQGRPVRPGDAFTWPAGQVHEYRNPGNAPKRILCIDRPKFIPEDEVLVTGAPELIPAAPVRNYLA